MEYIKSEIQIQHTTIRFSNNILILVGRGGYDKQLATLVRDAILDVLDSSSVKINILADFNEAGKSSSEARDIWRGLAAHKNIGKIACIGGHPLARILAVFILKLTQNGRFRFYSKTEEAMNWLNT
jgi:hypothetical protein